MTSGVSSLDGQAEALRRCEETAEAQSEAKMEMDNVFGRLEIEMVICHISFFYIYIYTCSAPPPGPTIYIYVYIYILYLRYPRSFPFFPNIKENPGAVSTRGSRNPGIPNHKSWDSSPQNYLEVLALCTGTSSYLHHTLKQLQSFIIQSWFNLWSHFRSRFSKLRRKKPRGKGDEGSKIPKKKHQAYATLKRRFLPLECHIQTLGRKKWIDANLISVRSKEPSKQIWVS